MICILIFLVVLKEFENGIKVEEKIQKINQYLCSSFCIYLVDFQVFIFIYDRSKYYKCLFLIGI